MPEYLKTDYSYNSAEFVETFDELPLWAAPFGLKLLDSISYRKGFTALDIGFGAGFPLTEIAMRLGRESKIYGVDPWDAAVDRAEKKIKRYGIQNVEIIRGKAEEIPLADNSIDLIVSNNGLNNVEDASQALSECSRLIKSGGQFVQTMNLNSSMDEFYSIMKTVLIDMNLDICLAAMQRQIYDKRKPLEEYSVLIKSHGFDIEKILHDSFDYKFVDGTTMLHHHFFRMAFMDGWKSIVPTEQQVEVFQNIENRLNEFSEENGCFKLTIPFVLIDARKT